MLEHQQPCNPLINNHKPLSQPGSASFRGGRARIEVGGGLANLGNTCFMNSVLQCLVHTPAFNRYLERRQHSSKCKIRATRPRAFCLSCSLEELMRRTSALGPHGTAYAPRDIATALPDIARGFRLGRQEDAHEFMRCALERMTKEFTILSESARPAGTPGRYTALQAWLSGTLQSQIRCLTCSHESNTYDPFLDLSLELRSTGEHIVTTLDAAMQLFCQKEFLDHDNKYKCERCNALQRACKQLTLNRPPTYLTVHLKRFSYAFGSLEGGGSGKISAHVAFPLCWNVTSFTSAYSKHGDSAPQLSYLLYAVLVHEGGSTNSGHYYCYVREQKNSSSISKWWCLNDSHVGPVSEATVLSACAYMLFYALMDCIPQTVHHRAQAHQTNAVSAAYQPTHIAAPSRSGDALLIGPQLPLEGYVADAAKSRTQFQQSFPCSTKQGHRTAPALIAPHLIGGASLLTGSATDSVAIESQLAPDARSKSSTEGKTVPHFSEVMEAGTEDEGTDAVDTLALALPKGPASASTSRITSQIGVLHDDLCERDRGHDAMSIRDTFAACKSNIAWAASGKAACSAIPTFQASMPKFEKCQTGTDSEADLLLGQRMYGCEIIQQMGIMLYLTPVVIASAQDVLHIFYSRHSIRDFDVQEISCAALLLTSRAEGHTLGMQNLLDVFSHLVAKRAGSTSLPLNIRSHTYARLSTSIERASIELAKNVSYSLSADQPHKMILSVVHMLAPPGLTARALAQTSWNFVSDSHRLDACVHFAPEAICCAAFRYAARVHSIKLPSNTSPPWWECFGVTKTQLDDVSHAICGLYTRSPARYVRLAPHADVFDDKGLMTLSSAPWCPSPGGDEESRRRERQLSAACDRGASEGSKARGSGGEGAPGQLVPIKPQGDVLAHGPAEDKYGLCGGKHTWRRPSSGRRDDREGTHHRRHKHHRHCRRDCRDDSPRRDRSPCRERVDRRERRHWRHGSPSCSPLIRQSELWHHRRSPYDRRLYSRSHYQPRVHSPGRPRNYSPPRSSSGGGKFHTTRRHPGSECFRGCAGVQGSRALDKQHIGPGTP